MAFRTGPYFESSRFIKGAGIQQKPEKRPLFDLPMASTTKPRFAKIDRRYRQLDDVPRWLKNPHAPDVPLDLKAGKKRAHDETDGGDNNVQSRPRKRRLKEEEWALIKCCRPLLCCLEFGMSWTPARLARNKKEREKKLLLDEMEHVKDLQEQLTEHPDYIIVNGRRMETAAAEYNVGSPTTSSSTSPIMSPDSKKQWTQTSLRRHPGATGSGPYRPGAPRPPSDDEDDNAHRPNGGRRGIQISKPTQTQTGVHIVQLPGGRIHTTGPPIHKQPTDNKGYKARLPLRDDLGRLVNNRGRLVNERGLLVDEKGRLVDRKGNRILKLSEDKPPTSPITASRVPQRPLRQKTQLLDEHGRLVGKNGMIPARIFAEDDPWLVRPTPPAPPHTTQATQMASSPTPIFEERPQRPHAPAVKPPTPQPSIPEAGETSKPISEDEIPRPQYQQQPQPQPEPPVVEPGSTQSNTNKFAGIIKNMSAAWTGIAYSLPQTANTVADPTFNPTYFLDDISIPREAFRETDRPGRMPSEFQSDEEEKVDEGKTKEDEQERKDQKNKTRKTQDTRTPHEKFLAKEKEYAPLSPCSVIRGTPRGRYGLHLAPDLVIGEDFPELNMDDMLGRATLMDCVTFQQPQQCRIDGPRCQDQEGCANTFATGRELRAHELTHDFMMSGGFGPPGSVDGNLVPFPIPDEERERLLRAREVASNSYYPVDQMKLALAQSEGDERQRVERVRAATERTNRLLTEGDFAEEMTQEEFEQQFAGGDEPVSGETLTEGGKMTGEEYQQQLLSGTIGDEAPDPNFQQTYEDNVVDEAPIFHQDQMQQAQDDLSWEQRNVQFTQQDSVQHVYTDEEMLDLIEEDERRKFYGY